MNILVIILVLLFAALAVTDIWFFYRGERFKAQFENAVAHRSATVARIERELRESKQMRNVAWSRPPRRVAANEIKRAFAVDETAPLWVALNQELDDYIQDVLDEVSQPPGPAMSEETRTHLAGGVEHLRKLQKRLLDLNAAAQKVDQDLESDSPAKEAA